KIKHVLVVRVTVNGGHRALLDSELLVDDLDHRPQTIRGAGCVGNDVVLGGIVGFFIHAQHNGNVLVLGGSGNDDFFHWTAQVLGRVFGVREFARGFYDDLGAHAGPVDF